MAGKADWPMLDLPSKPKHLGLAVRDYFPDAHDVGIPATRTRSIDNTSTLFLHGLAPQ